MLTSEVGELTPHSKKAAVFLDLNAYATAEEAECRPD
jgi:hypothetical protein